MPYDPRPVSQGGNRGLGEDFEREPENGQFRVIGVDTFDGTDWVYGDYPTLEEAVEFAREESKGKQMLKIHVYDKDGKHVFGAGSF